MGILPPNDRRQPPSRRIEDAVQITYDDYTFDDSDAEDEVVVIIDRPVSDSDSDSGVPNGLADRNTRRKDKFMARKAVREARKSMNLGTVDGINIKRNMGARKWRRVESARILSSFTDAGDICFDCSDLVPEHLSAFARILQDQECMKAWNNFIEKDEAEQNEYLAQLDKENDLDESFDRLSLDSDVHVEHDARKHHPAYSTSMAFHQLDRRFRDALSKRHVPIDLIDKLEGNLRTQFQEDPSVIWTDTCDSSFRRFYIHAVAQYLKLKSKSSQGKGRLKETQVFSTDQTFSPPDTKLVSLIRSIRNASRQIS
ncbi:unnamed protein product [Bursaphelenchus xylophilus]|uniref:(pine wood nematode) hypothetical protein n=1 Tax=Bursaphelenchus xylophilus TaxID=6326 RepID=A0A1I7RPM5_BURXY|nr:unnamed protein product [Bursaphelenchus xylophilus]CAG9096297.1 unnamed protein product [Bursaphelenchus xylophilus]